MAVTVSSSKIDITSGTETLASVYTAVAASGNPGVMVEDTINKEYSIVGTVELEISTGATLNITDSSYDNGYLQWSSTGNGVGIDVDTNGNLNITAPGFIINLDVDNGSYRYMYLKGNVNISGTSGNNIIIKRYFATRCWAGLNSSAPYINTIVFNYVNFQDPSTYSTSNYALWFDQSSYYSFPGVGDWSFTNITIDNTSNSGYIFRAYSGDWSNVILDGFDTTNTRYGCRSDGGNVKFTNSTFRNIATYAYHYTAGQGTYYYSPLGIDVNKGIYQPKWTYENCTFQDNGDASSTEYGARLYYCGAIVKYKNCTFIGVDDEMSYGIDAYMNPRILLEGGQAGQTFTNVGNEVNYGTLRAYYDVYSLDLTVNDSEGSPLADASVTIRQKEGKESHAFETDSSGNIIDMYGDLPVFVHRVNYTNSSTFDLWSDGTGDQIHEIIISYPGYQLDTREVAFTEDKTIVAQLSVNEVGTTKMLGNNTFYNSNIY